MSNAAFLGTFEDKDYLPNLKGMFNGLTAFFNISPMSMLSELEIYCSRKDITKVVSTNTALLSKLLAKIGTINSDPKLSDYAGSFFTHKNIEIVFIAPLKQLFTVSYGKFLAARYISKLVSPEKWLEPTPFSWTLLEPPAFQEKLSLYSTAIAIAIDIETIRIPLKIKCISYTAIFVASNGSLSTDTIVFPLNNDYALGMMRSFNALPIPKIFQNGKYDNAYLLRFGAPVTNWLWDTAHFMHSYYSELPKDLGFLNAFFLRRVVYWKDLAETTDLFEYYKYNGMDSWATANVFISWILSAPAWAKRNYTLEFPLVFPCLLAEMTGIERDPKAHIDTRIELDTQITKEEGSLQRMLGSPSFNPRSPVQVKNLLKVLGCGDIESTVEKDLNKAAYRHPLNARIISKILDLRGLKKLVSTYLRTDDDAKQTGIHAGEGGAKEFCGRLLYSQNPHGTDTGRLASGEHAFWCGFNIQNIPRGPEVKKTLKASSGFYLAECDLEQAESRDTAHISGSASLIAAVTGTRDFHSVNASAFFGIPYEDIYDDTKGKTKNKKLRDIAKRVNHGANYNMGPAILVDTMGFAAIFEAASLLKLPFTDPLVIAEYLLYVFHRTYPELRGPIAIRSSHLLSFLKLKINSPNKLYAPNTYYASVANEINVTSLLVSRAYHHLEDSLSESKAKELITTQGDWTRYCFGKPTENKPDLNAYAAHCPQSLNARTLNEAFLKVFYTIALPNPTTFRLHAQIHDSILFSYHPDHPEHALAVKKCMEIPVTVRGIDNVFRTFTVPAALKLGTPEKPAVYWNETE